MNPSYMRVKVPSTQALRRFAAWLGLPVVKPPYTVRTGDAVAEATCNDAWISAVATLVYPSGDWTVFEDLTGYLSNVTAAQWLRLSARDELVFAGYNDAIGCGQLVVIRGGEILCDFLQDEQDNTEDRSRIALEFPLAATLRTWSDVAAFVDEDEFCSLPDEALLVLLGTPS